MLLRHAPPDAFSRRRWLELLFLRGFAACMAGGLAAACVIVPLLAWQGQERSKAAPRADPGAAPETPAAKVMQAGGLSLTEVP